MTPVRQRVQKIVAQAGLCSRRTAEEWMLCGRVTVNGVAVRPGDQADPDVDCVLVDGKPLERTEEKVYLMLHKPRGYVTTLSDEFGRKTAAELVQDCGARVFPVGRLDMDSEGLLLFTNDGELMQRLIHPKFEVDKLYRVTVRGDWEKGTALLRQMRSLEGEVIAPAQVELVSGESEQAVLHITIHQGKNRQIRRMCKQAGLNVLRLERLAEHGIMLGNLPCGKWRALTDFEVRKLKGSDENDP